MFYGWIDTVENPTGGSFTLTYGSQTPAALPFNASAAAVASALNGLTSIQAIGTVVCSGGPFPGTPIAITIQGPVKNPDRIVMTSSLTGAPGTNPRAEVTA